MIVIEDFDELLSGIFADYQRDVDKQEVHYSILIDIYLDNKLS